MYPAGWLQNHPHLLERLFQLTLWFFRLFDPIITRLGYDRVDRWIRPAEELGKKALFDCRMCGQCVLHSTGMTCPMTCPKNLRNGPCGGVRADGNCEVLPEMRCIWVDAYERSLHMPLFGREMTHLQPPLDRRLEGTSAWINVLTRRDNEVPTGWQGTSLIPLIKTEDIKAWKPSTSQKAA